MVVVEDFKVQLVSVEEKRDTYRTKVGGQWKFQKRRRPFREHTRGGKTYVEVEPDEEYYISIAKIRPSTQKLYTDYYVDGQSLHFHVTWERACLSEHGPRIVGIHSRHNGIKTTQALQFVKATCTSATATATATTSSNTPDNDGRKKESNGVPSTAFSMAGMGQIQMMVFEAIPKQVKKRPKVHTASSFAASTIAMTPSAVSHSRITATKKNVRSGAGVTATVEEASGNYYERDRARYYLSNTKGEYLYTITLYYCAPPGLIAVGILSQPPAYWTHARTVHPTTNTTLERAHITKGIKSEHVDHHTGNVIIELVEDDDETDADAKADPTSENTKQNTADTNNNIGMVMHPDDDDNRIEEQRQTESSTVSPRTKKFKSNPIDI